MSKCRKCGGDCCHDAEGRPVSHAEAGSKHACDWCEDGHDEAARPLNDEEIAYLTGGTRDYREVVQDAEKHGVWLMEPRKFYDPCLLDVVQGPQDGWKRDPEVYCAVYSLGRLVEAMVTHEAFTSEEAVEWIAYNVAGGWYGEGTPVVIDDWPPLCPW